MYFIEEEEEEEEDVGSTGKLCSHRLIYLYIYNKMIIFSSLLQGRLFHVQRSCSGTFVGWQVACPH